MVKLSITLIEDEPSIADTVVYALESEGYAVQWRNSGLEAIEQIKAEAPDLVILDIGLPDINGFDAFRQIRSFSQVPVIFLTARNVEIDKVTGLEMGADDYIVKPFSPRELTARVRAVLRRTQGVRYSQGIRSAHGLGPAHGADSVQTGRDASPSEEFSAGPFAVDNPKWTIRYHSTVLELTRHEFQILSILIGNPERIFSREKLLEMVWEAPEHRLYRTVDAHIKNIRAKLRNVDSDANPIKTKRGVGYFASWSK